MQETDRLLKEGSARFEKALIEFDINEKSINIYVKSTCGEAKEYFSELRSAIRQTLRKIKVDENLHNWPKGANEEKKEGKVSLEVALAHWRENIYNF